MSGRACDASAQLALLDAMVFFAAALLVTGMMFSQRSARPEVDGDDIVDVCDPAGLLDALMKASLGGPAQLATFPQTSLTGYEEISQSLSFELDELSSGTPEQVFAEVNQMICEALSAACPPAIGPHLIAFNENGSFDEPLLAIPSPAKSSSFAAAASVSIPSHWSGRYTVVLVLDPALPTE